MSAERNEPLLRWVDVRRKTEWSDAELLAAFRSVRDESAFEVIVRRHGPMVLGVCRRMLRHAQDAEDAYQAVFLVLARRNGDLRQPDRLANWLYGVAIRTALEARARAHRRGRERQVAMMPESAAPTTNVTDDSLQAVLDEELSRLPEKLRGAVILCDLQGKTREEAAYKLGVPVGTLSGRLTTAHRRLAARLARRGVTVTGAALAAALSAAQALEAAPPGLLAATVQSSTVAALHGIAASGASVPVAALAQAVITGMRLTRWKLSGLVLLLAVLIAAPGLALARYYIQTEPEPGPPPIKVALPNPPPPLPEPPIVNIPAPKLADGVLSNDLQDIFVVNDQAESLVDFLRNSRITVATLKDKDLQKLATSRDRWVSVSMGTSSNLDENAARGGSVSAAVMPMTSAVRTLFEKVASRPSVSTLLRQERPNGIYDVIGYTDRPSNAFFTNSKAIMRSGEVTQKDLQFVHPHGPKGTGPQPVLNIDEIRKMPQKFGELAMNDFDDIIVLTDRKESLTDFFHRNRVAAGTIFVSDYRRLCRSDQPWTEIPVAPLSFNDPKSSTKRTGRTAKVARPTAGFEIQCSRGWLSSSKQETITMFLLPDDATGIFTIVGQSSHRSSFQFFDREVNVDKAGTLRQCDLRYQPTSK